ncbi:MAG: microcin C transport system substrate-binding protein [Verrucomicrobiales bacterium]|jgi:microcin C transport system substrate-binding protein
MKRLATLTFISAALFFSGCGQPDSENRPGADFEGFVPQYNRYIATWLERKASEFETQLKEIDAEIAKETDPAVIKKIGERRISVAGDLDRITGRQQLGDYFQFKTAADMPEGLVWENGQEEPEIGDPASKKGGAFRYFISSFPPNIRPFGPNANNSFRGELYDNIEMGLVDLHPETGAIIPGVASEWATGADKKTVYFKIDPDAKYNDGVDIKSVDFMWYIYVRTSDNVVEAFFSQYLREQMAQLTVYGDDIIAVTLPNPRPKLAYFAGDFPPSAPHFYKDYGPDYKDFYQWRVPPTTAPYTIRDGDIVKGVSINLSRVDDWWAKDKKFYRYRYNADNLLYLVVRDISKAWELFRAGELDYFPVSLPKYWYEKSEMPPVFDGYIERYTWYNQFPRIPWALYLNMAKPPLDDLDVRIGVSHATNWNKVIDIVFRGDASRLPGWTKGFGGVDNPDIEPLPFSISKAREHFAKAGYTEEGDDGILQTKDGKRLEVILTYSRTPERTQMMNILEEEAARAGLDFITDGLDHTQVYKKEMRKEHQAVFSAWGFQPPYPRYYEYFHSSNAYDEKGNLKQDTNNVFSFRDERMDQLALAYRNAVDEEKLIEYAHEMQEIISREAVFIPGYMTDFLRIACWRWVRWPDSEFTELSPPMHYIPMESYAYWIDEEIQAETQAARRSGKTFPEIQEVKDRYRTK